MNLFVKSDSCSFHLTKIMELLDIITNKKNQLGVVSAADFKHIDIHLNYTKKI